MFRGLLFISCSFPKSSNMHGRIAQYSQMQHIFFAGDTNISWPSSIKSGDRRIRSELCSRPPVLASRLLTCSMSCGNLQMSLLTCLPLSFTIRGIAGSSLQDSDLSERLQLA